MTEGCLLCLCFCDMAGGPAIPASPKPGNNDSLTFFIEMRAKYKCALSGKEFSSERIIRCEVPPPQHILNAERKRELQRIQERLKAGEISRQEAGELEERVARRCSRPELVFM